MVDDDWPPEDWRDIWGDPVLGDWDLDDMEALLPPAIWKPFNRDMTVGFEEFLRRDSWPLEQLARINELLDELGISRQDWWWELYGR